MTDEIFMRRCLEIASSGLGTAAPNPLVGAVFVSEGKIISEGYHKRFGGPHAEVEALKPITRKSLLQTGTLYVNLEPCSHYGKTPPCTELILEKGIKKIVIANTDPNPLVNGKGIRMLAKAGVNVTAGILEEQGRQLNCRFFTYHQMKRPYVILKWAQTADGYIAPVNSNGKTWISNKSSRILVHKWRGEEQAILVGKNTVLSDDPELTTRHFSGKNPVRVILDPLLSLPRSKKIFDPGTPVLVFNTKKNTEEQNVKFISISEGNNFIKEVLEKLFEFQIQSIIVEGGAQTLEAFINSNLWDEARVFTSRAIFGAGVKGPSINKASVSKTTLDGDELSFYFNR